MVLLDEKSAMLLPPPPPYIQLNTPLMPPPPFYEPKIKPTLSKLPAHILLQIIHLTFPQSASIDFDKTQRQRRTLHWLESELRLVNRVFYIACMHVLRSTYLPAYQTLVRRPYSSDPFPMLLPSPATSPTTSTSATSIQRETVVLDLFISLKVREDVWADDTEFHLESEERFRDLFELMQPKSRLEDLVRTYGEHKSVITCRSTGKRDQVEFWRLSVGFTPRLVSLVYQPDGAPRKKWFEVQRQSREESLEVTAKRIVKELERRLQR